MTTPDAERRLVAVLGTPCGGTNWTHQQFKGNGIEVGHERVARDGIVCGFALWSDTVPRKVKLSDYDFRHFVRLVRHPLKVAETLPTYIRLVRGYEPWGGAEDRRLLSLRYWVHTFERMPEEWPLLRLECFEEDFPELCRRLGGDGEILGAPHHSKPRAGRFEPLTWRDWEAAEPEYAARGRDLCRKLGVPI